MSYLLIFILLYVYFKKQILIETAELLNTVEVPISKYINILGEWISKFTQKIEILIVIRPQ